MKDIYKNPMLYYIAVPVLIGLWPLLVWGVYLPKAKNDLKDEKADHKTAMQEIRRIMTLDPGRLKDKGSKDGGHEFDYAVVIQETTTLYKIPATNYVIRSRPIKRSKGQKTQIATVSLKDVKITTLAEFLSTMQLRWASLQCEKVGLQRKKTGPDVWDVDLSFKYYF